MRKSRGDDGSGTRAIIRSRHACLEEIAMVPGRFFSAMILVSVSIAVASCTSREATSSSSGSQPPSQVNPPGQPESPAAATGTPRGTLAEDISKVEPKFKLTAEALAKELIDGKKTAAAKYKDAVIELSGTVMNTEADPVSKGSIVEIGISGLEKVTCMMVDPEPWSKVSIGSKVKIKGKWLGRENVPLYDPLYGCVFVEVGPNPAIITTAEDLAREFAANKVEAEKKFDGKTVILEGEVVSTRHDKEQFLYHAVLKGEGGGVVNCWFAVNEGHTPPDVKSGQRIKLVGGVSLKMKKAPEV